MPSSRPRYDPFNTTTILGCSTLLCEEQSPGLSPSAHWGSSKGILNMQLCSDVHAHAQAARRQPVYQCLVEGCPKLCTSVGHRRQHLVDAHQFPSNYDFSRMHLMLHGGQLRPQEQFQRGKAQRMPARLQAEPSSLHKPANQLADEAQSHEGLAAAEPLQQAHGHQEGRHAEQNQPASSPGAGGQLPSEADEVGQLAEEIARLETGSDRGSGRRGRGRGSTRGRWFGVQQRGR